MGGGGRGRVDKILCASGGPDFSTPTLSTPCAHGCLASTTLPPPLPFFLSFYTLVRYTAYSLCIYNIYIYLSRLSTDAFGDGDVEKRPSSFLFFFFLSVLSLEYIFRIDRSKALGGDDVLFFWGGRVEIKIVGSIIRDFVVN